MVSKGLNRGNRELVEAAVAALALPSDAVAADVGFGGGIGLRLLLDAPGAPTVHGVEVSATMISQAQSRFAEACSSGRLHTHLGPITDLPLESAALDGLITVNTVYFIEDLDLALREVARTLRGTGRAAIGIGDPQAMEKMSFTAQGFLLRPISEVEEALSRAGLVLADHRRVGEGRVPAHVLVAARSSS
jgi:SAM-dependent methyltransferase